MRISDWSSDVCSSDLEGAAGSIPAQSHSCARGWSDVLANPGVKLRAAIAEKAHAGTVLRRAIEIDAGDHHPRFARDEFGHHIAQLGRASGPERVCQYV